jgi:3-keto-5-aminohexanoate cleavage enzyme
MVRKMVPNATIGMHAGGRNWLPVTAMAIMFGIDLVRIGIEDQFWACPHKDEVLKSPVESVQKVAAIARALGRDIATPQEAREILGMQVTWKK